MKPSNKVFICAWQFEEKKVVLSIGEGKSTVTPTIGFTKLKHSCNLF